MQKFILLTQDINAADSTVSLPVNAHPFAIVGDLNGTYVSFLMSMEDYRKQLEVDPEFKASFIPSPSEKVPAGRTTLGISNTDNNAGVPPSLNIHPPR